MDVSVKIFSIALVLCPSRYPPYVNVVKTLIAQGFPPDRLFAAGFGEFQPKYPNDSDEHRRLNRRVEIGVTPLQKSSYEERKVK